MPSLQQINVNQAPQVFKAKKKSKAGFFIKLILFLVAIGGWYVYRNMPDIVNIPEDVWATRDEGKFKELFETPYKKIIWFGADCPISAQRKKIIDAGIKYRKLETNYIHRPFLQNSFSVKCKQEECMDRFIMNNCASGVCIIIPNSRKIIHTTYEHMVRDVEKYKNY